MTNSITFRQLESLGSEYEVGASALDEWYKGVRDTPISELDDGDLSRACRQMLYLSHVVPAAVKRLLSEPLAGDMYDGELLVAMKSIPIDYWQTDRASAEVLANVVEEAKRLSEDNDIVSDADELAGRLLE